MTLLTTAQYMAAAILVGVGLLHLQIWGRLRDRWLHFFFGLTAVCAAGTAIAEIHCYSATTVAEFNTSFKWANSINGASLPLLVYFVLLYSRGWPRRRWPAHAISVAFAVMVVANFVLPYGFLFSRIDDLRYVATPWGERIAMASGSALPWRVTADICLAVILFLVLEGGVRLWRLGDRRRAVLLGGAVTLFAVALLVGSLIDIGLVSAPYMVTYAYLVVALAMSNELSAEVVRAARLTSEKQIVEQERDRALAEATASLREVEALKSRLEDEVVYLTGELESRGRFTEIVGESDALRYVLKKIEQVAPVETTVLIEGETGVGKELVARAIHSTSRRRSRPMIAINMSALPPTLVEAELFGHERGAFTGAMRLRKGRFELADGGTLFLDEVAEMPMSIQGKLLRVLQDGEFERLGGERSVNVDVRIIAATNKNLTDLVEKGDFREDLFYRLHVYPITVPPLRKRVEDIPLLVSHFVRQFAAACDKTIDEIPQAVMDELRAYSWPGNIREMQNVIERAVLTTPGRQLRLATRLTAREDSRRMRTGDVMDAFRGPLEKVEREYIIQVLESRGWRVGGERGAARLLGLHPNTLRSRMSKLQIDRPRPRDTAS